MKLRDISKPFVYLIREAGQILVAFAKVVETLTEKYSLFSRLSLLVALGIAWYATARIFGASPPVISDGAAAAYGCVAVLVTTVAGLYIHNRSKKG